MTLSISRILTALILLFGGLLDVSAQTPAPSVNGERDVLIFTDGERLIGRLERSVGSSVTFKSDMAGEVTVDWSKIKELRSQRKFAVVKKDTRLRWRHETGDIPQGTLSVADQKIEVGAGQQAVTVPVSNTNEVIEQATFNKVVFQKPGLLEDWKGAATVGISLVSGTQSSQTYTSAVSLVRALPTEAWLDPSSRTSLNFTSSYGQLKQPATALVKTSLFHADVEQDHYFSPRVYSFGSAGFDHDYSQGLDLEQTYGGGVGWTALKRANQELDLRGELTFVNQQFFDTASDQKLLGSAFSESYNHRFKKKIVLHEQIGINPALTNTRAYSATGNVNLSMPVMKRISFTVTTADEYLNDPSPGFRRNSYQFTTGLTYTVP